MKTYKVIMATSPEELEIKMNALPQAYTCLGGVGVTRHGTEFYQAIIIEADPVGFCNPLSTGTENKI